MNGKRGFDKKIRSIKRTQNNLQNKVQVAGEPAKIGSWILEEDEHGNLLAKNTKTGEATIVAFL